MASENPSGRRVVRVIVNPQRRESSDEFVEALGGCDCDVDVVEPTRPSELAEMARAARSDGVDVVAAVGGDGTQRTVAAELAGSESVLAVVPGGTVNLLARVIGVDDVPTAARAVVGGARRTIDLGRCGDELFVLNASTGYDANVIHRVDDDAKRFGRLGYAATGLIQLIKDRPRPVSIEVDGAPFFAGKALTVLVLNVGQRGSDRIHLAPDAQLDDGLLDLVVIQRGSVFSFVRTALAVIRGRGVEAPGVRTAQAADISVTWSDVVRSQRDGDETEQASRFSYESVPSALRICVPANG